jgi:hypothetical protein
MSAGGGGGGVQPATGGASSPAPLPGDGGSGGAPAPSGGGGSPVGRVGEVARATLSAINFPEFVASLIQGTFQAIVDASIQQMEAYAELLKNVAGTVDRFMQDNITDGIAHDHLADQYAGVFARDTGAGMPRLAVRQDAPAELPSFFKELGLDTPQQIDDRAVEEVLVPATRRNLAERRQQTLATMVLMGINRVVVRDGEINAKLDVPHRRVGDDGSEVRPEQGQQRHHERLRRAESVRRQLNHGQHHEPQRPERDQCPRRPDRPGDGALRDRDLPAGALRRFRRDPADQQQRQGAAGRTRRRRHAARRAGRRRAAGAWRAGGPAAHRRAPGHAAFTPTSPGP